MVIVVMEMGQQKVPMMVVFFAGLFMVEYNMVFGVEYNMVFWVEYNMLFWVEYSMVFWVEYNMVFWVEYKGRYQKKTGLCGKNSQAADPVFF